jgi:hypothetical protein
MLAAVLLGALVAGFWYYRDLSSPRYTLRQMVKAVKSGNYEGFYAHLDMPSLIRQVTLEAGQEITPRGEAGGNALGRLGQALGRKLALNLVPKMLEGFDKNIRRLLMEALRLLTPEQLEDLEQAVEGADITQEGESARVTLRFPRDGERLGLTMRRDPKKRVWRVVSVSYQDLKRIFGKELE